jgi:hypothetical protein
MDFERVQVVTILQRVVGALGKAFFELSVLPSFSSISLHDLLHAIGDGFKS